MNKLNILAVLPASIGGRLTLSSIADGFLMLGHNLIFYDELKKTNPKKIMKKNFDFLLGYDFSAIKFKIENELETKTINYFSDEIEDVHSGHDWAKYYENLKESKNYTFCWDKVIYEQRKKIFKNFWYMPHFVNCNIYKNLNLQKPFDVMFAGRLDTKYRLNFYIDLMKKLPKLKFGWYAIERHFEDAILRVKDEEKILLRQAYQGFIDTEEKMSKAINETKIIFNMNEQGFGSLNYRTFQVMACESLLISDRRAEIEKLFKVNKNILIYENKNDLIQKINFYLKNEKEYKRITTQARKIILKNHEAKTCSKKMLELIFKSQFKSEKF